MKKNESLSFPLSSEDYLFGKAIPNYVAPVGSFPGCEIEVRKLVTQLGLCNRPDAKAVESERRHRVACAWMFRRDHEAYDRAGEKGFRLAGLNYISRNSPSASFDYQLELPF